MDDVLRRSAAFEKMDALECSWDGFWSTDGKKFRQRDDFPRPLYDRQLLV